MLKYSVISILKTFSSAELNLFGEFLKAPFINKNTKASQLYDLLRRYHPEYSDKNLSKENLLRNLAGNVKFKESYIRNLFSDLNLLAEKFLQFNLIMENSFYERLLIEELKNRDLYELAEKKIKAFGKLVNSLKAKDHEYYFNKSFIYEMKSFLIVDKTLTDSFRNEQISSVIKLFLISLMENSFYLIVEEQRVNVRHRFDFLKHTLQYMKHNLRDFEDSPLIMIYYYIWQCYFLEYNEEYFLKAGECFRKNFRLLTKIDKTNIYSVMQIYYINKIDSGNTSYNKEFLNFLLEMLKFNVLSHKQKDFINLNLYRNILILSYMLKGTGILQKFVSKYIKFIDTQSRESVLAYSNSFLYFLQGRFEKSLEQCNKIDFNNLLIGTNENLFFKNDIKSLTLKCLYELNAFESAISHIDAFKHFLKNSKLIKEIPRKKHMNFLNLVNDLIRLNLSFDKYSLIKIKNKIHSSKELMHSAWLTEKADELERKCPKQKVSSL